MNLSNFSLSQIWHKVILEWRLRHELILSRGRHKKCVVLVPFSFRDAAAINSSLLGRRCQEKPLCKHNTFLFMLRKKRDNWDYFFSHQFEKRWECPLYEMGCLILENAIWFTFEKHYLPEQRYKLTLLDYNVLGLGSTENFLILTYRE